MLVTNKEGVYLCSKALHMVLLSVQGLFCHKQWEAGILDTQLLDLCVKEGRDGFPDEERAGTQDIAACKAKDWSHYNLIVGNHIRSCMLKTRRGH